jgi:transcriptional antiterminator RfaH
MAELDPFPPIHWYALYTKPRHEKKVHAQLLEKQFESYLPLKKSRKQWSDRKKWVEEPLFKSYLFVHTDYRNCHRALTAHGALKIVTFGDSPALVRDAEIDTIKRILLEDGQAECCFPVSVGDAVEIIRGPLMGIRGRLEEIRGVHRLVIVIESIKQALRFSVDLSSIKVVEP